jgi:hypothetical protein
MRGCSLLEELEGSCPRYMLHVLGQEPCHVSTVDCLGGKYMMFCDDDG